MKLTVRLYDTEKSKEEEYCDEFPDEETAVLSYSEGNFSCDCNRHMLFYGDFGNCGDERFRVISITNEEGKIIYSEAKNGTL